MKNMKWILLTVLTMNFAYAKCDSATLKLDYPNLKKSNSLRYSEIGNNAKEIWDSFSSLISQDMDSDDLCSTPVIERTTRLIERANCLTEAISNIYVMGDVYELERFKNSKNITTELLRLNTKMAKIDEPLVGSFCTRAHLENIFDLLSNETTSFATARTFYGFKK